MNKSEIKSENRERINFAVKQGMGLSDWKPLDVLSGGLSGVPVYKIEANNQYYVVKLDNIDDKNFDPQRCYTILETVAKQGIAPPVYFTDAARGIILMKYIHSVPRPESSPESMKQFAGFIRQLHHGPPFAKWKSLIEIINHIYLMLPSYYHQMNIVERSLQEILNLEKFIFDPADIRPSHCDVNPNNVLFDGENYFLVDWQAASPQSFYFDLACCANFFYFYNEDICAAFLSYYFEREPTKEEGNKYYLMRIFTHIFYGIIFLVVSLKTNKNISAISNDSIVKLPGFLDFMQSIGSGKANLALAEIQQQFGFVLLKTALTETMSSKYQSLIN